MSKVVYIVLTKTSTMLSRAIQLYTHENFTHASIAFDSELREMYSFGRKKENNPFIGGFVHENPSSKLLSNATCAIYSCEVTDEQYALLKKKIQYYQTHKELYRYNLIGLFCVACRLKWQRPNAFFCSQFVATLLQQVGITLKGQSPYLTKPADLAKLPNLNLCYFGKMKYYIPESKIIQSKSAKISAIQYIA